MKRKTDGIEINENLRLIRCGWTTCFGCRCIVQSFHCRTAGYRVCNPNANRHSCYESCFFYFSKTFLSAYIWIAWFWTACTTFAFKLATLIKKPWNVSFYRAKWSNSWMQYIRYWKYNPPSKDPPACIANWAALAASAPPGTIPTMLNVGRLILSWTSVQSRLFLYQSPQTNNFSVHREIYFSILLVEPPLTSNFSKQISSFPL